MLMALFQNKESLSSNKTTRVCGQADKNVQLQARPRGLIGVRRDFNLLLHPIVIRRLTLKAGLPPKTRKSEPSTLDYPVSSDSMDLQLFKTSTQHSIPHNMPPTYIRKNVPSGRKPTERKPLQKPKPCTTR